MKKFDLKAALDGAKVVTRDGREVTQLTLFEGLRYKDCPLLGVMDGYIVSCRSDGIHAGDNRNDLFMATEVKTYYVGVYRDNCGMVRTGDVFPNDSPICKVNPDWIKTISFEIEE
ncbi:MAG: hypothetical protein ACRDE7_00130 [Sphingobacterium sp.]